MKIPSKKQKLALWRIIQWAVGQGCIIEFHPSDMLPVNKHSPFSSFCGIDWKAKKLYLTDEADPGDLIHELAHLLATDKPLKKQEEFDFFGWEYILAKQLGVYDWWLGTIQNYYVTPEREFGELSQKEQRQVLRERKEYALKMGMINKDNKVICDKI